MECAVFHRAFKCVECLLRNPKTDIHKKGNPNYPSPTARAFINFDLKIAKLLYEKEPNVEGCKGESLLSFVFFHCVGYDNTPPTDLLDSVEYLLGKGRRLPESEITKIYLKLEQLSKNSDCIDSLILILDAHR